MPSERKGNDAQVGAKPVKLPPVYLRMNGKKVLPTSGLTWDHINPATGEVDATIPLADADAVDEAVECAHAAFDGWRRTRPARRRELLLKLADLIEAHRDEFARLATADNALPWASAPCSRHSQRNGPVIMPAGPTRSSGM